MSRPKFLVLSDRLPNVEKKTLTLAKREFNRRKNLGEDGIQIWRSYPSVETLIFNMDGPVKNGSKEYYDIHKNSVRK